MTLSLAHVHMATMYALAHAVPATVDYKQREQAVSFTVVSCHYKGANDIKLNIVLNIVMLISL